MTQCIKILRFSDPGPEYYQKYETIKFPGGEIGVRLDMSAHPAYVRGRYASIRADLKTPSDIMELLMVTNALRHDMCEKIHLMMPYVPYGRQDRVAVDGESLSIKVFADLINSQNYDSVEIWDPHSDVTPALINNCEILDSRHWIESITPLFFSDKRYCCLVAPDLGASKKVAKIAKDLNIGFIQAHKARDPKTGKISDVVILDKLEEDLSETSFLIVDDICDGGGTFIQLAKVLKSFKPKSVDLYVTHGIFSKGFNVFDGIINQVFCPNFWDTENLPKNFFNLNKGDEIEL